jgi:radical SAM superfamily enzyme YgiQ (UPF0313 family)/alkylhydroperoxidase/carboxymuconolactone decarboxylase family protein YurZ
MTKPTVLFVHLPSTPIDEIQATLTKENRIYIPLSMPMGILYLSACIKQLGNVAILDYPLNLITKKFNTIDDFIQIPVNDLNMIPDIISFTLTFSCSYAFFEKCLNYIRKKWPDSKIIVGGNHATNTSHYLIKNPFIHYVIEGEGEITFPALVRNIREYPPGIYQGVPEEDLDKISFPDWDLIDMNTYMNYGWRNIGASFKGKLAAIITTRGCPYRCTFCSSHTVHGRKVRVRSVGNVVQEVRELYERYGVNCFTPEDDSFISSKERTITLIHQLNQLNIPGFMLQFPNVLPINTIDEDLLDLIIKESNTKMINLALESGSTHTQKHIIRKNVDLVKARRLIEHIKNIPDIIVRCTLLLGFPGETKALMDESVNYAKSLGADWYIFAIATPLPGSEMCAQFINGGYITDSPDTWNRSYFAKRFFDTAEITAQELNEYVSDKNIQMNFLHNNNFATGNYKKAITLFHDVVQRYPFHIVAWYCLGKCYEGMGDITGRDSALNTINALITTDSRAMEMYLKFGGMLC